MGRVGFCPLEGSFFTSALSLSTEKFSLTSFHSFFGYFEQQI